MFDVNHGFASTLPGVSSRITQALAAKRGREREIVCVFFKVFQRLCALTGALNVTDVMH